VHQIITPTNDQADTQVTDEAIDIVILEKKIERLEAELKRATRRAEQWAKLYDELQELKNDELNDDDDDE
jgi:hypothetical protein